MKDPPSVVNDDNNPLVSFVSLFPRDRTKLETTSVKEFLTFLSLSCSGYKRVSVVKFKKNIFQEMLMLKVIFS